MVILNKRVIMRTGPRPLSAQIGMSAAALSPDMSAQDAAQHTEVLQNMLLGIQAYHRHPYERVAMPLQEVWRNGQTSLSQPLEVGGAAPHDDQGVLVFIPSLINKSYILDLHEKRSMLRWFAAQGYRTYMLDWGDVAADKEIQQMNDVLLGRLVPAIEYVAQKEQGAVHTLGYCMGGTMLLGAAMQVPDIIRSVVMLAAPWDFHAGSGALLDRIKFWGPTLFPVMTEKGVLPVDWMQILFASLDPTAAARKFAHFALLDHRSAEAALFVAVEDWLNDGIDLPAGLARECIQDWFLRNKTAVGDWAVGGQLLDLADAPFKTLIVASHKDKLVEYETAAALQAQMPSAHILEPGCGHIGR